jgi:DNA-binding transcriptional LysR family regulator
LCFKFCQGKKVLPEGDTAKHVSPNRPHRKQVNTQDPVMTKKLTYLMELEAFHQSVECGSFSAAAVSLASTPSAISRAVVRLEQALGAQLLRRSTRSLSLTDAGRLYLKQTRAAFELIEDAQRELVGAPGECSGRVRVSVPTTWGHYVAAAKIAEFRSLYPQVQIELSISNRSVDLVAEGFDLAVRMGKLPDSGLAARTLLDAPLVLVCAPQYLATTAAQGLPRPREIADLAAHICIPFIMPSTGKTLPWALRDAGQEVSFENFGTRSASGEAKMLVVSEDVLGCVALAEHGAGITQSYDFVVAERLRSGKLVELLPHTRGCSRRFSLIYPPHRHLSRATRALIAFLCAP